MALVGDAAYCCSPLSGQGTSVALLGAYILAGELKRAAEPDGVDHGVAFINYFARFHEYIERTQFLATDNIPGGAPISQEQFDAIVPLGAAAILAVAAPARDGLTRLTLTCDHRVVAGADAARFLATLDEQVRAVDGLMA
ncbi:MAG: hypothetical protein B7W97_02365 [Mycobacterium sp. 20-66-4]|nr:MAG: hypothetical protein B7W97_02365 [Mycobacterium sp. 20-66-4]